MSSHIPDNIKLLGLIVKTIPHTHVDNVVSAEYSASCDIEELKALRTTLNEYKTNLPENASELERRDLDEDIYFIDTVIIDLEKHSQ